MKLVIPSVFFFFLVDITLAQLVLPLGFNCTMEQIGYCGEFLSHGGLSCQRNNQTVCEHTGSNNKDYCQPAANYNCRTFISVYGYICNTTSCIQSDNII
jgi:hypothetical protein